MPRLFLALWSVRSCVRIARIAFFQARKYFIFSLLYKFFQKYSRACTCHHWDKNFHCNRNFRNVALRTPAHTHKPVHSLLYIFRRSDLFRNIMRKFLVNDFESIRSFTGDKFFSENCLTLKLLYIIKLLIKP